MLEDSSQIVAIGNLKLEALVPGPRARLQKASDRLQTGILTKDLGLDRLGIIVTW